MKKGWDVPAQIVAWLSGMVFLFVSSPPRLDVEDEPDIFLHLVQFALTVIAGLCFVAFRLRGNRRKHAKRWGILSAFFLVLGLLTWGVYLAVSDRWTCQYDGRSPMVTGSVYQPDAAQYVAERRNIDCRSLLADYGGRTDMIWSRDELSNRRLVLVGLFSLPVAAFVLAALFLLQALLCAPARTEDRDEPASTP